MTESNTTPETVSIHDVVDQATDIFTAEGRDALRSLENDAVPTEAEIQEKVNASSDYGYWNNARVVRRDLVTQMLANNVDPARIPSQVSALANFIENGEGETPREKALKNSLSRLGEHIEAIENFVKENFPKKYEQRADFAAMVISLLEVGYDIPADADADDEDDDDL